MDDFVNSLLNKRDEDENEVDYDQLSAEEKTSYLKLLELEEKSQVTLETYKKYIKTMREAVELELANYERDDRKDIFLKARLKNYLLLEALFDRPNKAKEMIATYTSRIKV